MYGLAVQSPNLYKWAGGDAWSLEPFSKTPVKAVRSVFAVSGATPDLDTVFVATSGKLFVRVANKWVSKRAPGEGLPFHMTGERPDQVFVGGSDLCLWNGTGLVELEEPDDDTMHSLVLTADDRLVGGTTYANVSTSGGGWERIPTPVDGFYAFARLHDDIYGISDEHGLVRLIPGPAQVVSPPIDPWGLVSTGDGLIAYGADVVFTYDGSKCRSIRIPLCEYGGRPA